MKHKVLIAVLSSCLISAPAFADIKVGVVISTTGPAASLGIPERDALTLFPREIGGEKIEYIVMDDASDTTAARRNTESFIAEGVDVVLGTSTSPGTLAMIETIANARTPLISFAAAARLVNPMDEQKKWVFKTPYNDTIIAEATVLHMKANGVKTLGYIGFNDAYGESWHHELKKFADKHGVAITVTEKYNPKDTSVLAQALKVMAANPDAVITVGSGTPAVLPQRTLVDRGYKGKFYQTSGVVNNEFIRVGGKAVENTILPAGPIIVADELPVDHAGKAVSMDFKQRYEASFGEGSLTTYAGNAWDSYLLLEQAIPVALQAAEPGTVEFREALRDALENTADLPATHGIINMTPQDHNGFDAGAPVMITIKNGDWTLAK